MKIISCAQLIASIALAGAAFADPASARWNMFDRRLGMFVHWGIYSAGGLHEQEQLRYGRTRADYNKRMTEFTAEKFTGDNLIDVAESAGAEYIVVTAKHHDGFCLWDTKTTDFNAVNSAAKRDLIGELAAACKRRGMKLGFYFSNPDWHQPFAHNAASTHQLGLQPGDVPDREKYIALVKAQVTELLTNYGEIVCFFWDIPSRIDLPEMDELVRQLQPGIMINDRGWGNKATCDYSTPERDYKWALGNRHVEACDAVGVHSWGYRVNEDYRTTGYLTRNIDRYLSTGGNYLLNIGPKADGSVPEEAVNCLRNVGKWYGKVRDSYRCVISETNLVRDAGYTMTRRGNEVFLHFREAPSASGVFLRSFERAPREAVVMNTGTTLKSVVEMAPWSWGKEDPSDCLHLMGIPADELANEAVVIRMTFDFLSEWDREEPPSMSAKELKALPFPDSVQQRIAATAARIKVWKGEDEAVVIPFVTDIHDWQSGFPVSNVWANTKTHALYLQAAAKVLKADLIGDLGDKGIDCKGNWRYPGNAEYQRKRIKSERELYQDWALSPMFSIPGNHDHGSVYTRISNKDFGRLFNSFPSHDSPAFKWGRNRDYGRFDVTDKRCRVLFVNTTDTVAGNGYGIGAEQLAFFREQLESTPSGWSVVVFSHRCLHPSAGRWDSPGWICCRYPGFEELRGMIRAVAMRKDVKLLGCICGDSHFDLDYTEDGVRYLISQGYGGCGKSNFPKDQPSVTTTPFERATDLLIDVACIKPKKGMLKVFRIGAGDVERDR